jgi:tripartite-type tricarboxylate transporter receptor subunit TctC
MKVGIRIREVLAATVLVLFAAVPAGAQEFPAKPVTVVVPSPPGGSVDLTARAVAAAMSKVLGQPFTIDNRAGAAGGIGHQFVARAAPDGYTLVASANGTFTLAPRLAPQRLFAVSDFAPVGMMTVTPMVLAVTASGRFKDFGELAAFARANPGKLTFGHPGGGTTNQVAVVRLQQALGTSFNLVAYKGSAPALTDLAGGQIDGYIDQIPSALNLITGGKLRALAVTTRFRSASLPEVPTFAEAGLPGIDMATTMGLQAPAGTPERVVAVLGQALVKALDDPDVKARLAALGSVPQPMSPAEYAAYLRAEDARAEELARQGNLKAD